MPQIAFGKTPLSAEQTDTTQGKRIYSVSCVLCHGAKGKGDGPASIFIGPYSHPRPANFTSENFKFRSTESGELPTLDDLMRTIRHGIPGYMPSFKHLDEVGIRQVALYISDTFIEEDLRLGPDKLPALPPVVPEKENTLPHGKDIFEETRSRTSRAQKQFPSDNGTIRRKLNELSEGPMLAATLSYQPGKPSNQYKNLVNVLKQINSDAELNKDRIKSLEKDIARSLKAKPSALRGKKIFHEMQCIACHGLNGKGHEANTNMKDERGLPVMAADLTQPSSFGNGSGREDIFRTIMTGLNGTPMPSFSDLFIGEEDQAWDLVEYVYSLQEDLSARFSP